MEDEAFPDASDVYDCCRTIFSGQQALIRKRSKVVQLLNQNQKAIARLTCDFSIAAITAVATHLLKEEIFESKDLADERFPKLRTPSTAQGVKRALSETDSSEAEAGAAQKAARKDDNGEGKENPSDDRQDTTSRSNNGDRKKETTDQAQDDLESCDDASTSGSNRVQQQHAILSLQPIYLPFKTQNILLTALQRILEECCFDFSHHWVPNLMEEKGWREVESLELTQWTQWFPKAMELVPVDAIRAIEGKTVAEILSAVGAIRHAAVHRVRTSAEEMLDMLGAAGDFANMLSDESRMIHIQQLRTEIDRRLKSIGQSQTKLQHSLTEELSEIAHRRAELSKLEKERIEAFRATDEQHRNEAGAAIQSYLEKSQKKNAASFAKSEKEEEEEDSDEAEQGESSGSMRAPNAGSEDGIVTTSLFNALQ